MVSPTIEMTNTDRIIAINTATVKLPTFTSTDPYTWFIRSEAQFRSKNITRSPTKSDYILQALPEEVCTKISTFLRKNPTSIDYDDLKAEILRKYTLQSSERVRKVMEMIAQPLGDRSPRTAWEEMTRLLQLDKLDEDGNFKEVDVKRELWLLHLPEPIRASLHDSSSLSIENLLTKADNPQISHRSVLQNNAWRPAIGFVSDHTSKPMYELNQSEESINVHGDDYKDSVAYISSGNGSMKHNKSRPFQARGNSNTRLCYYHSKWGNKARSCAPGCLLWRSSKNESAAQLHRARE